ncbi:hypothetical protein FB451DRAFT_1275835 [Mycena latifolia]|nr:hypothetical protein FB451DRAFT_1275835 [Mycena latifolia]
MTTTDPIDSVALLSVSESPQQALPVHSGVESQSPVAPLILTIPPEITAEIFAHCLPSSPCRPEIDTAPLLLGRICRDWRSIALDSPELWASLEIDGVDVFVDLVEIWLSRARNFPLTLVLKISILDEEWNNAPLYIDVLQRHAQTWRDVMLELPFENLLLFRPDLQLPMLERLTIGFYNDDEAEIPVNAFRHAPSLRHLQLDIRIHPEAMPLPWAQLTSFESPSGVLTCESFLIILQCTPNITKCKVDIHNETEADRLPKVPPLMFLTTLSLGTSIPKVMDILEHLSFPALQVLDLSGILLGGRELLPPLHRFLSKPGCRLRELAIRIAGGGPRDEDIIRLLETQPGLEKFNLCEGSLNFHIAICQRLSDGSPFLPRLGHFIASPFIYPAEQITTAFPVMLDTLVDALSARWVAPPELFAQIRECTLSWSGSRTQDLDNIVAAFRLRQEELAALGIKMSVGEES